MKGQLTYLLAVVLAVIALATAACGQRTVGANEDGEPLGYTRVGEPGRSPGQEFAAPADEVVLRITGDVDTANADGELHLDMAQLEAIGMVAYAVDDMQAEGRRVTFTGVLLRDVLDAAGASDDAVALEMSALNDYAVSIPSDDQHESPVMIATRVDGERMAVADYGPIRVVYPYDTHDLDPTVYDPRWIWQLASIDVR